MQTFAVTPSPFIGRTDEIEEIETLLADPACRLLTLVGPGGIGKTRLATEVAVRQESTFYDGIFFVPLAPLSRTNDIVTAIADASPFRFDKDSRDPHAQFFDYLHQKQHKRFLFILDNFEHLMEGADVISELLAVHPSLKILVTSRESLNLQEEWVRQVSGLTYPEHVNGTPIDGYSAVQLFVDSARRVRGDFDLNQDRHSIVEICRLVGGIPLAIKLAAGWLTTLQTAEIVREIRQNMDILATRARNLPERHRSIRSVFDQSWHLLNEEERRVFQSISVFRGGFTRAAAEAVGGASLYTLAALVDKSLIKLNASGRYDTHELLRQYGAEQMDPATRTAVQRAYSDYYLDRLAQLEGDIKAHRQIEALDEIEADFENVRRAWQLAVEAENTEALNRAVESLQFFGDMRGRYHEVIPLLKTAVEQVRYEDNFIHARIEARLIRLLLLGNLPVSIEVVERIERCVAVMRTYGDVKEYAFSLLIQGIVMVWAANDERPYFNDDAATLFHESYRLYQQANDPFYRAEVMGWIACTKPNHEPIGNDLLRESLAIRRDIGDKNGIAWVTLNLTEATLLNLDYVECERYARQALALMRGIGSTKGMLQSMFKLAQMTMMKGDLEEARALSEELRHLAEEVNNIDGKMMAAGLLSFLVGVMDENYAEGARLAAKNRTLSEQPFFGGHHDLGTRWGEAIADCGMGQFDVILARGYRGLLWEQRDDPGPASVCLAVEAARLVRDGEYESAAEMLGAALHIPDYASGWLHRWAFIARLSADLIRNLGQSAYRTAHKRGGELDLKATMHTLLGETEDTAPVPPRQPLIEPLSDRELEVLNLIADGLSNRDIAERLVLSVGTVKVHTRNLYGKLNVNSRTQAIAEAGRLHLL